MMVFAVSGSMAVGMDFEGHPSRIPWPSVDTCLPFANSSPSTLSCKIASTAVEAVPQM